MGVSGNTLTMDTQYDPDPATHPSYPAIRAQLHAGDKLYIYHGDLTASMVWGPLVDFNFNRVASLLDMFYFACPPDGLAPSFFANGANPTWSYNLLTNVYGSAPTQHQDWMQWGFLTGHTLIQAKNNVVQSIHLAGFQMGGNPRDMTQIGNILAWTSGLEIANSIFDNSGLSTSPFYFQENGAAPVQMVLNDQETGEVRVVLNRSGSVAWNLLGANNGRITGDVLAGIFSAGDPYMVSGFPPSLASLNNRKGTIHRVYMVGSVQTSDYNFSRQGMNSPFTRTIVVPAAQGATSLTADNTSGLTPYLPITINGVIYTIATVDSATAFTIAAPGLSAAVAASTTASMPPSFTLAGTNGSALIGNPWIGNVQATAAQATSPAAGDDAASITTASTICLNDVSQIAPDMLLIRIGSTASDSAIRYTFPFQQHVVSVNTQTKCVLMSAPVIALSKNLVGIAKNDVIYFTTWTRSAMQKLVSMHDIYIKNATFTGNPAATGFSAGAAPGLGQFYANAPTFKPLSIYNLYQIADGEGTYGFGSFAALQAAMGCSSSPCLAQFTTTNPLRFGQFQTNWPQNVPVDAPYLVPLLGNPRGSPMSFNINGSVDCLASGVTTPRSLAMNNVKSLNPPCAAPTGLTATPNGAGSVVLTYTAPTLCGSESNAPAPMGETVSIDGGAWSDPLGVIHSGASLTGLATGPHTFSVRSMNAPDDYNVPRNPGAASALASATVQ